MKNKTVWVIQRSDGKFFTNKKYPKFTCLNKANTYCELVYCEMAIFELKKWHGWVNLKPVKIDIKQSN